jgi:hypothetical protein
VQHEREKRGGEEKRREEREREYSAVSSGSPTAPSLPEEGIAFGGKGRRDEEKEEEEERKT